MAAITTRLTAAEINALDPYAFLAVIGKRVIHPGGRRATEELFQQSDFRPDQQVLDIGCGVGTTAIAIARRFGANVTAADISPIMLARARANVRADDLTGRVRVEEGDITALPYAAGTFDRVVAEAVTMFVDRPHAARELVRVCRPGGRVLATEFLWRHPPTAEARRTFLGEVCPGMTFDTLNDWARIYREAGLQQVEVTSGPFEMMTPAGFLSDEGWVNCLATLGRTFSRAAYLKKMAWLMTRINRAVPYLGYIVVAGIKPAEAADRAPS
jgi:ubiquinone/menaquinone biosynthesis C-methylase UbiE